MRYLRDIKYQRVGFDMKSFWFINIAIQKPNKIEIMNKEITKKLDNDHCFGYAG